MDNKLNCKVCGTEHSDYPWGENEDCASFEICDCCGTTFGLEDATEIGIMKKRNEWIDSGGQWMEEEQMPSNWSLKASLASIGVSLDSKD